MSSIKQSNFRVVVGCKVCKDAGKPESEYSNHFVKDREGKVVCPTLLALQCRYCQKPGHTVSHCPTLAAKNKAEEKAKRAAEFACRKENKPKQATQSKGNKFAFDVLSDDEEMSEEEVSQNVNVSKQVSEEFPALGQAQERAAFGGAAAAPFSYATMAAKSVEEYENEQFEKKIRENALKNIKIVAAVSSAEKRAPLKASELNWAMEDSDSDSDEDW